jgi:putative MFS transporter
VHKGDLATARATVEEMEASPRIGKPVPTGDDVAVPVAAVAEPRTRFGELFAPSYRRRTAMLWCTWFTTYFALWGLTTFLPTLLVRAGVSQSHASLLSAAVTVGDMIVVYLAAATLDRLGRRFWFTAGYLLALVGAAFGVIAIGLAGVSGWVVLFIASATLLVGVNINAPLIYIYTAELYPTRMRAWATMVGSTLRSGSAVIAPIVLGLLVGRAGGIAWMFALFAAVLAVGLAVFLRHGIETKQRTLEELAQ